MAVCEAVGFGVDPNSHPKIIMITYKYFLEECGRFHKIMCDKKIMLDSEKRNAAKNGLLHTYMVMECSNEELENAASSVHALISEYLKRCDYIDAIGSVV